MVSTGQKLEYLYPTGIPPYDWIVVSTAPDDPGVIKAFNTEKLGPQPTQAELDALTDQQVLDGIASNKAKEEKAAAVQGVDDALTMKGNRIERIVMSVCYSISNAVNNTRTPVAQIRQAIIDSPTLTALKTAVAAIDVPPQVTQQQVSDAVKAAIAATPE